MECHTTRPSTDNKRGRRKGWSIWLRSSVGILFQSDNIGRLEKDGASVKRLRRPKRCGNLTEIQWRRIERRASSPMRSESAAYRRRRAG